MALPLGRSQRRGLGAHGGRTLLLRRAAPGALEHHQVQQLRGSRGADRWTRSVRSIAHGKQPQIY